MKITLFSYPTHISQIIKEVDKTTAIVYMETVSFGPIPPRQVKLYVIHFSTVTIIDDNVCSKGSDLPQEVNH